MRLSGSPIPTPPTGEGQELDRRHGRCSVGKGLGAKAPTPTAEEIDAPYCNPEWIIGESLELDFSPELGEINEGGEIYDGFSYDSEANSPYEHE